MDIYLIKTNGQIIYAQIDVLFDRMYDFINYVIRTFKICVSTEIDLYIKNRKIYPIAKFNYPSEIILKDRNNIYKFHFNYYKLCYYLKDKKVIDNLLARSKIYVKAKYIE